MLCKIVIINMLDYKFKRFIFNFVDKYHGKKTYLDIHYNVCRNQCKLCGKQNMKSYYPVIHRLRLLLLWPYS